MVVFSLFIPVKIERPEEFLNVKLGLPLRFVSQNQERIGDTPVPYKTHFDSPLESPINIYPLKFLISLVIVFIYLYCLVIVVTPKKYK